MKIRSVKVNNRKKVFEVKTYSKIYSFPYAKADPVLRQVSLTLTSPLELTQGEHLYVAVELIAKASGSSCLRACSGRLPRHRHQHRIPVV